MIMLLRKHLQVFYSEIERVGWNICFLVMVLLEAKKPQKGLIVQHAELATKNGLYNLLV